MKHAVLSPSADADRRVVVNDIVVDLHIGDCLKLFRRLADKSVDLLICDLPYGVTGCKWDRKLNLKRFWTEADRVLKPLGTVLMFGTQPFASELVQSNPRLFKYEVVWRKSRPTCFQHSAQRVLSEHENILIFSAGVVVGKHRSTRQMTYNPQGLLPLAKPRKRKSGRRIRHLGGQQMKGATQTWTNFPRSVLEFDSVHRPKHETQKPVPLLAYLIRTFSNPGDVVCDPSMGSGSTGVAAVLENRNFVGFELDPHYFQVSDAWIAQTARASIP